MRADGTSTTRADLTSAPTLIDEDGRPLPLRPTVARLLAALLMDHGRSVHAERLVERVWGTDPPAQPAISLHTTVARLRKNLPDGALTRDDDGYRLQLPASGAGSLHQPIAREPEEPAHDEAGFAPHLTRPWPLVGRQAALAAALTNARAGRGTVFHGDAGSGKSRLADEVVATLHDERQPAVVLRCRPAGSQLLLGVFAPLLERTLPEAGLPMVIAARESILSRLRGRRLVLGLDDVHLIDPLSAVLVSQLAHDGHVTIVATHRTSEVAPSPIAQLWLEGFCDHVHVPLLDRAGTEELAAVVQDRPLLVSEADRLWELTRGNALFVTTVLGQGGVDAAVSGSTLEALIAGQLGDLPTPLHDALAVTALAEPVGAAVLEALADVDSLVELERRQLVVVERDGRRMSARVRHPLWGEHVRATTSRLLARGIRAQLADAVQQRGARRHDDLVRVATWSLDGGRPLDEEFTLRAAYDAYQRRDTTLVRRLAGPLWDEQRLPAAGAVLVEAGYQDLPADEILLISDEALLTAGREDERRLRSVAAEVALFKRTDPMLALQLLEPVEHPEMIATRALAFALLGDSEAAARVIDEDPTGTWRNELHIADSTSHALPQLGRAAEVLALIDGMQDDFARIGRDSAIMSHYFTGARARVRVALGRCVEAEQLLRQALSTARASLDQPGECEQLAALATLLPWMGRPREAMALAAEAAAGSTAGHHLTIRRWALSALAAAATVAGDADTARRAAAELAELPGGPTIDGSGRGTVLEVLPAVIAGRIARLEHDSTRARAIASAAVATARNARRVVDEAVLLHELSLLGEPVADRLAELVGHDDAHGLVSLWAAHARAVEDADEDSLSVAAEQLAAAGLVTDAVDAARRAVETAAGRGRMSAARRLRVRWSELTAGCDADIGYTPMVAADPLTPRERDIAHLAAGGATSAEIAERLGLSVRTVDNHLGRVFTKLDIAGRAALAQALRG